MKAALLLAVVVIAAAGVLYLLFPGIFQGLLGLQCAPDDMECLANLLDANREECIPSVTEITNADGIILRVTISREGDRCVRHEEVIGVNESYRYLLGYNVTCDTPLDQLDDPRLLLGCNGSLQDYLVPPSGGGTGSGGGEPEGPIYLYCGLEDEECKGTAESYLALCTTSEIVDVDPVWRPLGYWTLYFNIQKKDMCTIYVEVLNAVDMPPGYPADIIGYNLTCQVPIGELPMSEMTEELCTGSLLPYF
jgi:hypothetical protein